MPTTLLGLGKTHQAIGLLSYYRDCWPALVVVPSSIKLQWRDKLLEWMGDQIHKSDICVLNTGKGDFAGQ